MGASLKALAKTEVTDDDANIPSDDDGGGSGSICVSLSLSECKRSVACSWDSSSESCSTASLKALAKSEVTDDGGGSGSICVSLSLSERKRSVSCTWTASSETR